MEQTIVVEGKYDRMRLCSLFDCPVIETGGFSFESSEETAAMIRAASLSTGIVILTDSDPAGMKIRSRIVRMLPRGAVFYHAYVPSVEGKEPRKPRPGAAGLLGVEGVSDEQIVKAVEDALGGLPSGGAREDDAVTADLYEAGLAGRKDSSALRREFLGRMGLPAGMSSGQMLRYLNATMGGRELRRALAEFARERHPE